MKNRLFNTLLLFSLIGIALGFFGMLYEGVVLIPNMLDTTPQRMQFWHNFYVVINPIFFYIPLVPLATISLLLLYFYSPPQQRTIKKQVGWAGIAQIVAMALTFYIVTKINLKFYLGDIEKYADILPFKMRLVNILSVIRLLFSGLALFFTATSCLKLNRAS